MLDSFTTETLLASGGTSDKVLEILKFFEGDPEAPNEEQVKWFVENKGKSVKILGTSHIGTVYQLNPSTRGFYPGRRYPIKVKITSSDTEGVIKQVFEYDTDQLEII